MLNKFSPPSCPVSHLQALLRITAYILALAFFLVAMEHISGRVAFAEGPTNVSGSINSDTTWTRANSPYIVTGAIVVQPGATLTIESGVEVRFAVGAYLDLLDGSTVVAAGEASNPIVFTSNAVDPQPGDWYYIRFRSGATGQINHCILRQAGRGGDSALRVESSAAAVRNCLIEQNAGAGIHITGAGLTPTLENLIIRDNGGIAIRQNTVDMNPLYRNLAFSGNAVDAVVIPGGTLARDVTLDGSAAALNGQPLVSTGVIQVQDGTVLTVTAGTMLQFDTGTYLDVLGGGRLHADGTATTPITFTSRTASPTPGTWYYIRFRAGGHGHLEHCVVSDAGLGGDRALLVESSDVVVRNCVIEQNAGAGIHITGAGLTPTLENLTIRDNGGIAIYQNTVDMNPLYQNLTLIDNGTDAVVIPGGTLGRDVVLDSSRPKLNGRPIILSGVVNVPAGRTLTVVPDTSLQFSTGLWLDVLDGGTLLAEGTADTPVIFSSAAASPAAGDWYYIRFHAGAQGRLAQCVLRDAGRGNVAALRIGSSAVLIRDCRIEANQSHGIGLEGAGISPVLDRVTSARNGGAGIHQNTIDMMPDYRSPRLIANGFNGVQIAGGSLTRDVTLDGSPAVLGGRPMLFSGSPSVAQSRTLTIRPGTTVQFAAGVQLRVADGLLVAEGLPNLPITFTTNLAEPEPGAWRGILFEEAGRGRLADCSVTAAGHSGQGAIQLRSSNVQVRNCRITGNAAAGVRVELQAQPQLQFNHILGNAIGVTTTTPLAEVDARFNWWGTPTGPFHPTLNPDGTGNRVGNGVLFTPWLGSPATDQPIVSPMRAGDHGVTTLSVYLPSPGLGAGTTVRLTRVGQPDIVATNVVVDPGGRSLTANVDLTGRARGAWTLVVDLPDGASLQAPDAFAVEEATPPNVLVDLIGRETIRTGRPSRYTITAFNEGNVQAPGAIVWVTGMPADAQIQVEPAMYHTPEVGDLIGHVQPMTPVVRTSDQAILNVWLPPIPAGQTVMRTFTMTVPADRRFTMEVYAHGQSGLLPNVVAPLSPQLTPLQDPGFTADFNGQVEIYNMQFTSPLRNTVVTHGITYPVSGRSCQSASHQRANDMRALREQPGSALEGWKVGTIYNTIGHFVNVAQSPHTGNFYLFDDYVGSNVIRRADLLNPQDPPGEWRFHIRDGDNMGWLHRAFYDYEYQVDASDKAEWAQPRPTNVDPKNCTAPDQKKDKETESIGSWDPNEKQGPTGVGALRALSGRGALTYAILFENLETAAAPAQEVVITDQLDTEKLDLTTFALGPIEFGSWRVEPPPGQQEYQTVVDLRPANDLLVQIHARLDPATGVVTWRFVSRDPQTDDWPEDPFAGFLPPNTSPPAGEGRVMFTVVPKDTLTTGDEIRNSARIIFDVNPPIDTNEWVNVFDFDQPASQVSALPASQRGPFRVEWFGTDVGTGIDHYSIFVSTDGGPYQPWLLHTAETEGIFPAEPGRTYRFYSVARDRAGNLEAIPAAAEATTRTPYAVMLPIVTRSVVTPLGW